MNDDLKKEYLLAVKDMAEAELELQRCRRELERAAASRRAAAEALVDKTFVTLTTSYQNSLRKLSVGASLSKVVACSAIADYLERNLPLEVRHQGVVVRVDRTIFDLAEDKRHKAITVYESPAVPEVSDLLGQVMFLAGDGGGGKGYGS